MPPTVASGCVSAWAQYCIMLPQGKRQTVANHLKQQGIPTNIYYPKPQHCLAVFASLGYAPGDMPAARRWLGLRMTGADGSVETWAEQPVVIADAPVAPR